MKKNLFMIRKISTTVFANNNDAFVPELWAQESLMILEANMVAGNLVYRDFEDEIQKFGDVVNTRRPAAFTGKRKVDGDNVTVQDAQSTNVPVTLNQHLHTSFTIYDGEQSKSFKDLIAEYLTPAVVSIAQMVDEIVLAQKYQFLQTNRVGKLGTALTAATIIAAREKLTSNMCPMGGRNAIFSPTCEGQLLAIDNFVTANTVGDDGTALREGSLGRKYGFQNFTCQNQASIAVGSTIVLGAINNGAGYPAGTTTVAVKTFADDVPVGAWITIAGDMTPHRITAETGDAPTTGITFTPALDYAVVDGAVITLYSIGEIDLGAGYLAGWSKAMVTKTFSVAPKKGQLISDVSGNIYGAIGTPTTTSLTLDRPLVATLADSADLCPGPAGEYNFAFHRNAIALVTRPLALPPAGAGARSFVASYNGLAIRVTMSYSGLSQGTLCTVDLLCGVQTLDTNLGTCILA